MIWVLLFIALALVVIAGLVDWHLAAIRNQLDRLSGAMVKVGESAGETNDLLETIERDVRPKEEDRSEWDADDWVSNYPPRI